MTIEPRLRLMSLHCRPDLAPPQSAVDPQQHEDDVHGPKLLRRRQDGGLLLLVVGDRELVEPSWDLELHRHTLDDLLGDRAIEDPAERPQDLTHRVVRLLRQRLLERQNVRRLDVVNRRLPSTGSR